MTVEASPAAEAKRSPDAPEYPAALKRETKPVIPDFPDVMPKVPVTLDEGRKRTIAPLTLGTAAQAQKTQQVGPETVPPPTAAKEKLSSTKMISKEAAVQDESVMLNASFFEHEEYVAPARNVERSAVDPEAIERARRFARLIVSDIALYNQDIVDEGLKKGTFFELLQDDITEGRSLYDNRVPETIRVTKDYYQEAFDDFIAAKKKQR